MSSQEMFLWKAEPVSPSGNSIGDAEDWFYINDKSSPLIKGDIDPEYDDINSSRAQIASKLLEQLDEWVKEGIHKKKKKPFTFFSLLILTSPSCLLCPQNPGH